MGFFPPRHTSKQQVLAHGKRLRSPRSRVAHHTMRTARRLDDKSELVPQPPHTKLWWKEGRVAGPCTEPRAGCPGCRMSGGCRGWDKSWRVGCEWQRGGGAGSGTPCRPRICVRARARSLFSSAGEHSRRILDACTKTGAAPPEQPSLPPDFKRGQTSEEQTSTSYWLELSAQGALTQ